MIDDNDGASGGGFAERLRSKRSEQNQEQEPVGEFQADVIMMGAMVVDSSMEQSYEQIKHFLMRSSSMLTASENVGELMPDLYFDAVEEKIESDRAAHMENMQDNLLESDAAKLALKRAVVSRLLRRLAMANVARKKDLIPKGLTVT
jgi:hypothetical protein